MSTRSFLRGSARVVGGLAVLGAGVVSYSLLEARRPVLRRHDVPVLGPGERPLTLLHLSDMHLTSRTEHLVTWVRGLARLRPDVVVDTGDNLSLASGLEPLARALEPFLGLPGAFVMGDHDYRSTQFRLPTRYLRRDPRTADRPGDDPEELPWEDIRDLQASGGWVDLTNRRGTLSAGGRTIELVGVDDPHVDRDTFPAPAGSGPGASGPLAEDTAGAGASASLPHGAPGPSSPGTAGSTVRTTPVAPAEPAPLKDAWGRDLRLGLLHAPYQRVLDAMAADDVTLALAGHTHGGQLCVPGLGALVTNCDLDRGRASGLSRWPASTTMYLHVSAGLGTSPYTPVRLACPPQATLLRLVPVTAG